MQGRDGLVPLSNIATLSVESGSLQLDRYDRLRNVTVSADLGGITLGAAQAAADNLEAMRTLPSNVQVIQGGDAEIVGDLMSGFAMALVVGVLCV